MSAFARWLFLPSMILGLMLAPDAQALQIRSIDGSGNNIANPEWGQADIPLLRIAHPAYDDGLGVPRGGDPTSSSSPRAISNAIAAQSSDTPNQTGASNWIWQWGQFLDHDIDLTESADPVEMFNVAVPTGDPFFDPFNTGTEEIALKRSVHTLDTSGVRQQTNQITAYIDASNIYGSDATIAADLRAFSDGQLKMDSNGLLEMTTGPGPAMFLSGDVRANEQIGLTATHTLFSREHNRLAAALAERLDNGDAAVVQMFNDSGLDRDEFLYQAVRKVVGAQIQKITYEEFLPVLLGQAITIGSYDDTVNAGISNEFSTAAYRFGHTTLSSEILRLNPNGSVAAEGNIALRDAFFNPQEILDHGIDSLLIGLSHGQAQEVDTQLIDDVRNFLFGPPGAGGFDLASLNIQRGRDHGLATINDTRVALGLLPYANFSELTGGDLDLAAKFASVYGSVDDVDLWIAGLAEEHVEGGMLGETFRAIIADQFRRLAEGDRFFYQRELDDIVVIDPAFESTRLSDIIVRNTNATLLAGNAFLVATPEPTTATLGLIGAFALIARRRRTSGITQ